MIDKAWVFMHRQMLDEIKKSGSFENSYSPLIGYLNFTDKRTGAHVRVDTGPNNLRIVVSGGV